MKYKNGEEVKPGDVIRWECWDSDNHTTWTYTGLVTESCVVYLGGGPDCGMCIGVLVSYEKVQSMADDNDESLGIEKIGVASDLARYIAKFGK